jgi:ABC-type uncharacterized transport system fused permease/ATPase subunit
MVRVRENAESIAFYGGEAAEAGAYARPLFGSTQAHSVG